MMTFQKRKPRSAKPKRKLGLCVWALIGIVMLPAGQPVLRAAGFPSIAEREEMNAEEKQEVIEQLLAEGEQYMKEKRYNLASASFESVFLLAPHHVKASESLDRLKKQMIKEGKYETDLVGRVYDAEIDIRVQAYWKQAKQLLAEGRRAQARFALQKLLLIQPLHEEARKLYEELKTEMVGSGV